MNPPAVNGNIQLVLSSEKEKRNKIDAVRSLQAI